MASETLESLGFPHSFVKEFEHWTLLVSPRRAPPGTLVLVAKGDASAISELSDESVREQLSILRLAERALAESFHSKQLSCVWCAPPGYAVQVYIVPAYRSSRADALLRDDSWPGLPKVRSAEMLKSTEASDLASTLRDHFCGQCEELKRFERVYTAGWFDGLRSVHLEILRRSKAIGEHLIVGVSTDEMVESESGAAPRSSFEERQAVVAALRWVDEVVPETHSDKQRLVEELDIDAITVWESWKERHPPVSCELVSFPCKAEESRAAAEDKVAVAGEGG